MDLIFKIKRLFTSPNLFFAHLKEKGVLEAFRTYASALAVSVVLGTLVGFMLNNYTQAMISRWIGVPTVEPLTPFILISAAVFGYVGGLLTSFVIAAIIHLWVQLFGGKADYAKTYQLYAYSRTPYLLLSWIPVISFVAWIYSLVLLIIGTHQIHKISTRRAALIYIIPIAFLLIVVIVLLLLLLNFASPNVLMQMKYDIMR
ncbi:MAG TPA: YIP1 family protein [Candidatus Nanoarchaeia archaeon]|nr:YIP1 family protein [Candidatus Nanoarchaeia archaeon]